MPFGRLHEEAAGDSKLQKLSNGAWRMWGMGLIYCQKNLTDGFIPADAVQYWHVRGKLSAYIAELCHPQVPGKAPLWERIAGGFRIHDYLQWNDSREVILSKRAGAKDRIDRWRERHTRDAAQNAPRNALPNADPEPLQNAHDVVRGSGSEEIGKGSGENPTRLRSGGVLAGSLPRDHRMHVFCDDTFSHCVPPPVHIKLADLLAPKHAGDRLAAGDRLKAWYPTVIAGLPPEHVMGDAFKFWVGEFQRAFATKDAKPDERKSGVMSAEETSAYLRRLTRP